MLALVGSSLVIGVFADSEYYISCGLTGQLSKSVQQPIDQGLTVAVPFSASSVRCNDHLLLPPTGMEIYLQMAIDCSSLQFVQMPLFGTDKGDVFLHQYFGVGLVCLCSNTGRTRLQLVVAELGEGRLEGLI